MPRRTSAKANKKGSTLHLERKRKNKNLSKERKFGRTKRWEDHTPTCAEELPSTHWDDLEGLKDLVSFDLEGVPEEICCEPLSRTHEYILRETIRSRAPPTAIKKWYVGSAQEARMLQRLENAHYRESLLIQREAIQKRIDREKHKRQSQGIVVSRVPEPLETRVDDWVQNPPWPCVAPEPKPDAPLLSGAEIVRLQEQQLLDEPCEDPCSIM